MCDGNETRAVKEAAERMRRYYASKVNGVCTNKMIDYLDSLSSPCFSRDKSILSDAYLSEHPVDDDKPVDQEWLRNVGFIHVGKYGPTSMALSSLSVWKGNDQGDWQFRFEISVLNRYRTFDTRGDVRCLCCALGITLKEGE